MRKQKGFSLIELLIVVAIILIIAAIAIPNLLRSRMQANQASAAGALRTITTANVAYSATYNAGFAGLILHLAPPAVGAPATFDAADLLDAMLSGANPSTTTPTKSGYVFTYVAGLGTPGDPADPIGTYTAVATPVSPGSTGQSTFCVDQTNVVMKDSSGGLTAASGTGCVNDGWTASATVGPM